MAGLRALQWTGVGYGALAFVAAFVGWLFEPGDAAYPWVWGVLPGPWAEELAEDVTGPRIFLVAVLALLAMQIGAMTWVVGSRLRRVGNNGARVFGGILGGIGLLVAAVEVWRLIDGQDGSGFLLVALAMVASGAWCAAQPFRVPSPPVVPSRPIHSTNPGRVPPTDRRPPSPGYRGPR